MMLAEGLRPCWSGVGRQGPHDAAVAGVLDEGGLDAQEPSQVRALEPDATGLAEHDAGLAPGRRGYVDLGPGLAIGDEEVVGRRGGLHGVVGRDHGLAREVQVRGRVDLDTAHRHRGDRLDRGDMAAGGASTAPHIDVEPAQLAREAEDRHVDGWVEADPPAGTDVASREPGRSRAQVGFIPSERTSSSTPLNKASFVVMNSHRPRREAVPSVSMSPWSSASRCDRLARR
jgi:hypothetical protein